VILTCPRCDDINVISPLMSERGAKYATCPEADCDYKLLIDLLITESEDQTITTTSSKETL
jgi:hypothetical protein